jgi:hypothetical protein
MLANCSFVNVMSIAGKQPERHVMMRAFRMFVSTQHFRPLTVALNVSPVPPEGAPRTQGGARGEWRAKNQKVATGFQSGFVAFAERCAAASDFDRR